MPAKNWDDTSIWYNQETKIVERYNLDLKLDGDLKTWLESCNVCSCGCGVEAVGGLSAWKYEMQKIDNKKVLSQADFMFSYIYSDAAGIWKADGVCENETKPALTKAINALSFLKAECFKKEKKQEVVEAIKESLIKENAAFSISYSTDYNGAGHYITLVNYINGHFIAYDSWPHNTNHCKKGGILEEYEDSFLIERIRNDFIKITEE